MELITAAITYLFRLFTNWATFDYLVQWAEIRTIFSKGTWKLLHFSINCEPFLNIPRRNNELLFTCILLLKNVFVLYGLFILWPKWLSFCLFCSLLVYDSVFCHQTGEIEDVFKFLNLIFLYYCLVGIPRLKKWGRYALCLVVLCSGPLILEPTYACYRYIQDMFFVYTLAIQALVSFWKTFTKAIFHLLMLYHITMSCERAPTVPEMFYIYTVIVLYGVYITQTPRQNRHQMFLALSWLFLFSLLYVSVNMLDGFSDSSSWVYEAKVGDYVVVIDPKHYANAPINAMMNENSRLISENGFVGESDRTLRLKL